MSTFKHILSFIPGYRQLRKKYHRDLLLNKSTEEVFTLIHQKNLWGNAETVSGGGSTLEFTKQLREELEKLIRDYSIQSILDIPCGDFNWMKEVDMNGGKYIGADIVKDLVQHNRDKYSNPNREFMHLDITKDILPKVDLIFCKDVFVHFSFQDIQQALENISTSGAVYVGVTHFETAEPNEDIITGEWRPVNFIKPPFNFPEPLVKLTESIGHKKYINVWKLSDIM